MGCKQTALPCHNSVPPPPPTENVSLSTFFLTSNQKPIKQDKMQTFLNTTEYSLRVKHVFLLVLQLSFLLLSSVFCLLIHVCWHRKERPTGKERVRTQDSGHRALGCIGVPSAHRGMVCISQCLAKMFTSRCTSWSKLTKCLQLICRDGPWFSSRVRTESHTCNVPATANAREL